jgi:hypothetical protein
MIYNPNKKEDQKKAVAYLDRLLKGSDKFIIEKKSKKRTLDQNALYWLWLACIEDETGNDKNYLHETYKDMFCPVLHREVMGELRELRSTKFLSTMGMKRYLDKVNLHADTELNIRLPEPNEKGFDEFYEKYKYL